jgi:hypothetical protein
MPIFRRSQRIKNSRKPGVNTQECAPSGPSPKSLTVNPKRTVPKASVSRPKAKEEFKDDTSVCLACESDCPPICRYEIVYWIDCDACHSWWHIDCVCMSKETRKKHLDHAVAYVCPFCVINSSPWLKSSIHSKIKHDKPSHIIINNNNTACADTSIGNTPRKKEDTDRLAPPLQQPQGDGHYQKQSITPSACN